MRSHALGSVMRLGLIALPVLLAAAPAVAQDGCVTKTLSLMVYYEDVTETAATITENIRPPMPAMPPPPEDDGMVMPAEPPPVRPPAPADCPTLTLPAADMRAQTACTMADGLPGARCVRRWGGLVLVVEPFD